MAYSGDVDALGPQHRWGMGYASVTSVVINAGGTGYVAGDTLSLVGGTHTVIATFVIDTVSAGVVTAVTVTDVGAYTGMPSSPVITTTNGAGTGCTVTPAWGTKDSIGTVDIIDAVANFIPHNGVAICEDTQGSAYTNGVNDAMAMASISDVSGNQSRKAIGGWFMLTAIQDPPIRVYGDGGVTRAVNLHVGFGNSITFEILNVADVWQIQGDVVLDINRAYHILIVFEGTGFSSEFSAYIDGVKQLDSVNTTVTFSSITSRTAGGFGTAGSLSYGGTPLVLVTGVDAHYAQWASWSDVVLPTPSQIRTELFEKGALPAVTIASGTQTVMQSAVDAYASTVQGNYPLCIRVEEVSGGGDLRIDADNITFNTLASIHIQYTGTGSLTWVNSNGGDASIGSVTNNGIIVFENPATLTVEGLVSGGEFRIYDDENADPLDFDTELAGVEALAGTSYLYSHSGATNTIVLQMIADGYEEVIQRIILSSSDQTVTILPTTDGNV